MTGLFNNDRYYLNMILGVLFVLGIGFSLYVIYSLPDDLHLASGFQSEFITVYAVLGLTFITGTFALLSALRYKKEIVVFRDRITDANRSEEHTSELQSR